MISCPAVSASTRTRIAPEVRRSQIVKATQRATLEHGLHDVRIADIAAELDVSTGLIHYHFATKEQVIDAMLREVAAAEIGGVRAALADLPTARQRLARLIDTYLPSSRRDRSWLLWIDVWGEALRDANLRRISEDLDVAWVEVFTEVIGTGVDEGVFRCADPVATAWRLCALLDGLGLQVVLHHATMTRAQMGNHVRAAASLELAHELGDA
jgi:AcrR family transcriptional regulator